MQQPLQGIQIQNSITRRHIHKRIGLRVHETHRQSQTITIPMTDGVVHTSHARFFVQKCKPRKQQRPKLLNDADGFRSDFHRLLHDVVTERHFVPNVVCSMQRKWRNMKQG